MLRFACFALVLLAASPASAQRVIEVRYAAAERAQIAIWIEGAEGTFLRTIRLTQATSYRGIGNRPGASQMNSGFRWPYGRREGVLPVWAHRRAAAPGALQFRRVIFQARRSEGDASRSQEDSSPDRFYCLSFLPGDEEIDAVACASVFNSDKGRFVTEDDVAAGYSEPVEIAPRTTMLRPLGLTSLYPPRRDVVHCTDAVTCYDHPDVDLLRAEAERVMPELDAITMATPPADVPQRVLFSWPAELPDGDYFVLVEVNTELDHNEVWSEARFPTPLGPDGTDNYDEFWDNYAQENGFPYRGQPSVVYAAPIHVGIGTDRQHATVPIGYGSLDGFGEAASEMHEMDGTISDDPANAPGSGADRLRIQPGGWRLEVSSIGPEVCEENTAPGAITGLSIARAESRRDAHRYARLSFVAPSDDLGVVEYQVRVAMHPIGNEADFMEALPSNAASPDSIALMVPTTARPGERIEVDMGGLGAETRYVVAVRAIDLCNAAGPIATVEHVTPSIQFETVSPCFVATAAYGSPIAAEVGALRRLRDRHLRSTSIGRALVSAYDVIGPVLADAIRDHDDARAIARTALVPIVALARAVE